MKLRTTPDGLIAHDPNRERWVHLPGQHDLLSFRAKPHRGERTGEIRNRR
jgi:hypothetical protein